MKFRDHTYKWMHPWTSTRHQWSFRGPHGGLHFHVSIMDDEDAYPDPSAGLEFHHSVQPYGEPEAPHHAPCWLTGIACWHDGTSLYAKETVWPIIRSMMPDHAAIFRVLEGEYDRHFEEPPA